MEYLSVCEWVRVATRFIRWQANTVTKGWDEQLDDILLKQIVKETLDSDKDILPRATGV